MFIEITLLAIMIACIGIKWFSSITLKDRHTKLVEANDELGREKARYKNLVSEVNMADYEIQKLQRKVRATEHRIGKLTKLQGSLQNEASKQAAVDQQKQKIAEEVRKAREG